MAQNGQDSRVAPLATEVHVLTQQPFLLHAQLLQDAGRRDVLVVDGRPNSAQLGLSKSASTMARAASLSHALKEKQPRISTNTAPAVLRNNLLDAMLRKFDDPTVEALWRV